MTLVFVNCTRREIEKKKKKVNVLFSEELGNSGSRKLENQYFQKMEICLRKEAQYIKQSCGQTFTTLVKELDVKLCKDMQMVSWLKPHQLLNLNQHS